MGVLAVHHETRAVTGLAGYGRHTSRGGSTETTASTGEIVMVEVPDPVDHANKGIDGGRTKENYSLKPLTERTLRKQFDRAFAGLGLDRHTKLKLNGAKERQSVVSDFIVTLPRDVPPEREREYFKAALDFYRRFGGGAESLASWRKAVASGHTRPSRPSPWRSKTPTVNTV